MKRAMIVVASMAFSGAVYADGPSWTYGEFAYVRGDSVGDDENESYRLSGSFGFADMYHVQASYFDGETYGAVNGDGRDEDVDGYGIRAGVNPAVTDNTDFVFQLGYNESETDDSEVEIDGITLSVGLRSMFTDSIEIFGYVETTSGTVEQDDVKIDQDYTDNAIRVGGQYFFNDNISINIEYINSDQETISETVSGVNVAVPVGGDRAAFGVRYSF